MKQFVVLLVCSLAATTLARPEINSDAVKESGNRIKQAHQKCQSDPAFAVDGEALRNMQKGGPAPANLGPHSLCVSKKLGWQNEDGSVNRDIIASRAQTIFGNNPDLQRIVDDCVVPKATAEATAENLFKCYYKNAPRVGGDAQPHH